MSSQRSCYGSRTTGSIDIHHTDRGHAKPLINKLRITSPLGIKLSSASRQPRHSRDHSSCQDPTGSLLVLDRRQPLPPTLAAMPTNQAPQIAGIPRTLDTVPTHQIRPTNIGPSPTGRTQMCLDSRAKPRTKTGPRGHLSVPLALRVLQRHITKVAAIRSSPTPESL